MLTHRFCFQGFLNVQVWSSSSIWFSYRRRKDQLEQWSLLEHLQKLYMLRANVEELQVHTRVYSQRKGSSLDGQSVLLEAEWRNANLALKRCSSVYSEPPVVSSFNEADPDITWRRRRLACGGCVNGRCDDLMKTSGKRSQSSQERLRSSISGSSFYLWSFSDDGRSGPI